jgi:ribonuclease R
LLHENNFEAPLRGISALHYTDHMEHEVESSEPEELLPPVTPEQVITFLAQAPHPLAIREIAHAMELKHAGRRYLPRVLKKLERNGEIEEARPGKFSVVGQSRGSGHTTAKRRNTKEEARKKGRGEGPDGHVARPKPSGDKNLIAGRLIAHRDGYGFVVPDIPIHGLSGDIFVGAEQMAEGMHGDRVMVRIERRRPEGRAEGRIVRVARRKHETVVGIFRYDSHGNVVLPYDTRLPHEIIIPPGEELTPELREKLGAPAPERGRNVRRARLPELDGAVVNIQITRYPQSGVPPTGRVVEILGKPGDLGVDIEIMIRKYHLPHEFGEDVLAEAARVPSQVGEGDLTGRTDFRDLPIVTIDGETARDFDDAVFVRALAGGGYELQVHIADVGQYVPRDSPLDHEARLRGTSVYFPDRAVPMLPEKLSNGICSLNPHVDRLVMSVRMRFDGEGHRVSAEMMTGVIHSAERMTYTAVNAVLESDPAALERYSALAEDFRGMRDLALLLNKRRVARGSIDFDLPEQVLELDGRGTITGILRSERNIAHRIIEEFMLAANEAVASELERHGLGFLHRVHEKPDPKKVLEFEELAKTFGHTLGVEDLFERQVRVKHGTAKQRGRGDHAGTGRGHHARVSHGRPRAMMVTLPAADDFNIRPQHYQHLVAQIAGRPEERILSYLMLRSLKQARYSPDPLGHFALATKQYAHFTSPIRRYPDLIVHRVLKWLLANPIAAPAVTAAAGRRDAVVEQTPLRGPYKRAELEQMATETSEAERRAEAAERELLNWKTAQFMEARLGEEFEALIISVQKFGFFVELMEIFVEGLVPVNRLEETLGERCFYRETDHAFAAQRSGRVFRLGDRVKVVAERIDPLFHRVEFAVVGI